MSNCRLGFAKPHTACPWSYLRWVARLPGGALLPCACFIICPRLRHYCLYVIMAHVAVLRTLFLCICVKIVLLQS